MTPVAKFDNTTDAMQSDAKILSGLGHVAVGGVFGSNLLDHIVSQFGLAVSLARYIGQTCQARVKSVFGVALRVTPFQVADMVISRVAVDVVNKRQAVGVWDKSICHQAMNKARVLFASFRKVNPMGKVDTVPMLVKGNPSAGVRPVAAILANGGLLRVCPNAAIIRDCINTLKSDNIFHIHSESHGLRSTMLLPTE